MFQFMYYRARVRSRSELLPLAFRGAPGGSNYLVSTSTYVFMEVSMSLLILDREASECFRCDILELGQLVSSIR